MHVDNFNIETDHMCWYCGINKTQSQSVFCSEECKNRHDAEEEDDRINYDDSVWGCQNCGKIGVQGLCVSCQRDETVIYCLNGCGRVTHAEVGICTYCRTHGMPTDLTFEVRTNLDRYVYGWAKDDNESY